MIQSLMLVVGICKVFLKYSLSYTASNVFRLEILNYFENRNLKTEKRNFIYMISKNYKCVIVTESV